MKRLILTTALIGVFLLAGTAIAILYAWGYQIFPTNGKPFAGTGMLQVTSKPEGAKVYIDDHLTTATNNTINLSPGEYEVKIVKEGYFNWHKKVIIQKEIVSQAIALLLPIAPKLESITLTGASNPTMDPTGSFLAYTTASSSAEKNGVYTLDLTAKPLISFGAQPIQIANDIADNFSSANLAFSPNGTELIASLSGRLGNTTYSLNPNSFNQQPKDVTATLFAIDANWKKQQIDKEEKFLNSLTNNNLRKFIVANFKNTIPSPDQDKILYTASTSATMPFFISPRIVGGNSTPEARNLTEGNIYIYDVKEDRNYLLEQKSDQQTAYQWHPDSNHLVYIKEKRVNVVDYDGGNTVTVYAGPFDDRYVFPSGDGISLIILTNLNLPNTPFNLYRLILK